jgi:predicted lipase
MHHRVVGLCSGHSLGGALATLAAYDLQLEFGFGSNLHCYTFGAPRTGNHAFAAESSHLVPETWHIINDRAPPHPDGLSAYCVLEAPAHSSQATT